MRGRLALLATVLATGAAAGCLSAEPGPRAIDGAFPPVADLRALPFQVVDHSGLVKAVAVVNPGDFEEGVRPVPGRDDALDLGWIGGMCDRRVVVDFEVTDERPAINVRTEGELVGGCPGAGVFRHLMIEFTQPVDASKVAFSKLN